jgi:hypothetical protein
VSKLRILKGAVLSAGIVAGLLGSVALAPSAFAQSYWNGVAPTTPGPAPDYGYGAGPDTNWGPNSGGWAPGGNYVSGASTPYWVGAPRAVGPGY